MIAFIMWTLENKLRLILPFPFVCLFLYFFLQIILFPTEVTRLSLIVNLVAARRNCTPTPPPAIRPRSKRFSGVFCVLRFLPALKLGRDQQLGGRGGERRARSSFSPHLPRVFVVVVVVLF